MHYGVCDESCNVEPLALQVRVNQPCVQILSVLFAFHPHVAMSNTDSTHTLVYQLNALLKSLQLPILLQSPTDLTPSLLIGVLESLLSSRIPLEFSPSRSRSKTNIQSMKVFLGVLESDIVKMDVGLSTIDPRRLANGEWEEVVFVGEVLCWVGMQLGLISESHDDDDDDQLQYVVENHGDMAVDRPYSPSTSSAMSVATKKTTSFSNFSLHRHTESNTSMSFSDTPLDSSTPVQAPRKLPSLVASPQPSPSARCIHEVPSPSIVLTPDIDNTFPELTSSYYICSETQLPQNTTVRDTGYIEPVDEELELRSFESNQSIYDQRPSTFFDDHKVSLNDGRLRSSGLIQSDPLLRTMKSIMYSSNSPEPEPSHF